MSHRSRLRNLAALGLAACVILPPSAAWAAGPGGGGGGGGGGGASDTGSLYSDLVVALREANGTPILTEYTVTGEEGTTTEYCVQPVSYTAVPGITSVTNPLDGRPVWVLPLQGEWIDHPVDPLPVEEIEPCDPMPQYAMFVAEAELKRLNLTRTSDDVLAKKLADVRTKLTLAQDIGLDPAGRLTADGTALDAAPEYASIYTSLMRTGALPGLDVGDVPYGTWQLAAVAVGTAASKTVPLTVDSIQYYNRAVGFTTDPLPSWGDLAFIRSADPDPTTPMPSDTLPGGENFVDYSGFTYNRGDTYVGSVTWLDVATLTWHVTRILDAVEWTNLAATDGLGAGAVNHRTLTGVTAFAQMADDTRAVIGYLHEHEVVLPGFYMDPVLVDTTQAQIDTITLPAVQLTAPARVFQTLPFVTTASLYNPWGGVPIDHARLRITVHAPSGLAPADVTVAGPDPIAMTASGADLVGWWGLEDGFAVTRGDRLSTDLTMTVAGTAPTGEYAVTLDLVDVSDPSTVLATTTGLISVEANATSVLWGGQIPSLATQGTYLTLPVRVYAPSDGDAVLTFALTGPGDDPATPVVEELVASDARLYASDGGDMVRMPLVLSDTDRMTGTWPLTLSRGYTDLTWYLLVADGAPVGAYGIDVGIESGVDLADLVVVSFAAPADHGSKPPDVGEDTTAPVVTITLEALTGDSATFSFTADEADVSFDCRLTTDGVPGEWADCSTGSVTYSGLLPAAYVVSVRGTDAAGNAATYTQAFSIDPDTAVVGGPSEQAWLLDDQATFTLTSTAPDATFDVAVNGEARPACETTTCVVSDLPAGASVITFTARTSSLLDPEPATRTVFVPVGVADLDRTAQWALQHDPGALFGTFAVARKAGETVSMPVTGVTRIAVLATLAPGSGKINVYLDKKRLSTTRISLVASATQPGQVVFETTFTAPRSGTVRVVIMSSGKPVRIEGIGVADR